MEQRTINIDGHIVYCYDDGSVEWYRTDFKRLYHTFGYNQDGYKRVRIGDTHYRVHRLIALAFHPNENNYPVIDHIDRNKSNNKPSNLRWCTQKMNADNTKEVEISLAKYGVRYCENPAAYKRARRAAARLKKEVMISDRQSY